MSRNKKNSQQILIRSPNWIGDQVMAFPFFKKVRECYPDAWITSVGVPWVKDLQYQSLVDEVVTFRKGHALQLSYRPDLAFTLTPSFSSGHLESPDKNHSISRMASFQAVFRRVTKGNSVNAILGRKMLDRVTPFLPSASSPNC
jgi:hypothetical protein